MTVNVPCITQGCKCTAEITQGKRRKTLKCPECGPLNFQTKKGQETLSAWIEKHGPTKVQNSPDNSTATEQQQESEPVQKKRRAFGFRLGGASGH